MVTYDVFARYYDIETRDIVDDLPFWVSLARRTGGPVLEVACGTGRVFAPLAEAGFDVVGVDISPAMLAVARDRIADRCIGQSVELIEADALELNLGRRFPLAIIALNSFGHFYEPGDPERALDRLSEHLLPGGLLALDLPNPVPGAFGDTTGVVLHDYTRPGPRVDWQTVKLRSQSLDPIAQIVDVCCVFDEVAPTGEVRRTLTSFALRYFYRNELQLLGERSGLSLEATYGNYDLADLDESSPRLIALMRKPRGSIR
jgi:SAM-dependent methyltransferase